MDKKTLTKNFTWEEVTRSDTAEKLGIDNSTDEGVEINIKFTAEKMQIARRILGEPIKVNSWYRSEKLNSVVGGSKTSAHCYGLAVDFVCPLFGTPREIVRLLSGFKDVLLFDQLICEDNKWVHIGWAPIGTRGRGQVLLMIPNRNPKYIQFA